MSQQNTRLVAKMYSLIQATNRLAHNVGVPTDRSTDSADWFLDAVAPLKTKVIVDGYVSGLTATTMH